jgi:hypothetical protein
MDEYSKGCTMLAWKIQTTEKINIISGKCQRGGTKRVITRVIYNREESFFYKNIKLLGRYNQSRGHNQGYTPLTQSNRGQSLIWRRRLLRAG